MQSSSDLDLVTVSGKVKISDAVRLLLKIEAAKRRKTTGEQYRIYLNEISREIGFHPLETFGLMDFEVWIADFKARKKRTTFNDYSKYLNKIYNFAYNRRLVSHRITFPLIDPKKGQVGRIYTSQELIRLYKFMGQNLRDQYVIATECYMRLREVLWLDETMIDEIHRCFRLKPEHVKTGSRTGEGRIIPWTRNVETVIKRRFLRGKMRFLFPNKNGNGPVKSNKKAWGLTKKRAGIEGRARWHDIRGTGLTAAVYEKKKNLSAVSKVAGVSVRTLLKVYAQPDLEQLRHAVGAIKLGKIS